MKSLIVDVDGMREVDLTPAELAELPKVPEVDPFPLLTQAIQGTLDAAARMRGYDDIKSAVSYRGDPNPRFAADAEAFFQWRSAIWTGAYAYLDEVQAGTKSFPTLKELEGLLPVLTIPTTV